LTVAAGPYYEPRHARASRAASGVVSRAGTLLVVVLATAYFAAFVHYGLLLEDEGLMLLQIARVFRGEQLYVDIHTGYPPGVFLLNAALWHLSGIESTLPIRAVLALVNAASVGLVFVLARPLAGGALAAAVALGWGAYLPVFVGHFAAFNVPYPSWYATCGFLATQLAVDRHLVTGRRRALVAAGMAAGLTFFVKQNSGALAVVACGLTLAVPRAATGDPDRYLARLLLVLAALFLLGGFTQAMGAMESSFIIGPALVLLAGRLVVARTPVPHDGGRLAGKLALITAGALAVTVPWLVPFLWALGVGGLLREIFLVGTDFALVYATPYPIPFGFPDAWPLLVTGAGAVFALGGVAAMRGWSAPRIAASVLVLGGVAAVALLAWWARIPEGFARSIVMQVQHVGFFAGPLLCLMVSCVWLRRTRGDGARRAPFEPRALAALVFAVCTFAAIYPRVDATHLLVAIPSVLVLGAWALGRALAAWAEALRLSPRLVTGAVALVGASLVLVGALPNAAAFVVWRDGALHRRELVAVASPAAPVVVEAEHASDVHALNDLLAYLRARLRPGEALFGFPGVALVPYLLGHPTATRHDYWYAGRPDHLEEAEVVRTLAAAPPRFIVTVNRNVGFFSNSARYYFLLREAVQEHYVVAARFGRYDVLRRRELAAEPLVVRDYTPLSTAGDGGIVAGLAEPLHESRRAAVRAFLDRAGTAENVAAVAAAVAPDEPSLLLLLRALPEAPDPRVVPYLARVFTERTWRVRSQAALALNYVALHVAEDRYLLGVMPGERRVTATDLLPFLDLATARRWLASRRDRYQVGAFSAWLLAGAGDPEAIPLFEEILRRDRRDPYVQLMAAYGLVHAGRLEYLCDLVAFLGDERHLVQDAGPSLLIDAAPGHEAELVACLRRDLAEARPRGREVGAWVAGALRLTGAAPALRGALADPERRVRIASAWALGRLADQDARPALQHLAEAGDAETVPFAVEALARLDGREP
jgi:HEAT repeat protein